MKVSRSLTFFAFFPGNYTTRITLKCILIFRWILHVRESENDQVIIETFDHVMVSTGLYRKPKSPVFKGSDSFKGKIMHMHEYRTRDMFVGKKVVIVGL